MTDTIHPGNQEQAEFWSEGSGRHWLTREEELNTLLSVGDQLILDNIGDVTGQSVLDVGCGTGATARKMAGAVGAEGQVLGVDVSQPFLNAAKAKAESDGLSNLSFANHDLQTAPLDQKFDLCVSRFGSMFFQDPFTAFTNLRASLKPGGRIVIACWASFVENTWFNVPRKVATDLLGRPPSIDPRTPGPFAFADAGYVLEIFDHAGFTNVDFLREQVHLCYDGDAASAAQLTMQIGPAASVIREMNGTEEDAAQIAETVAMRFRGFEEDGKTYVPAVLYAFWG